MQSRLCNTTPCIAPSCSSHGYGCISDRWYDLQEDPGPITLCVFSAPDNAYMCVGLEDSVSVLLRTISYYCIILRFFSLHSSEKQTTISSLQHQKHASRPNRFSYWKGGWREVWRDRRTLRNESGRLMALCQRSFIREPYGCDCRQHSWVYSL